MYQTTCHITVEQHRWLELDKKLKKKLVCHDQMPNNLSLSYYRGAV